MCPPPPNPRFPVRRRPLCSGETGYDDRQARHTEVDLGEGDRRP